MNFQVINNLNFRGAFSNHFLFSSIEKDSDYLDVLFEHSIRSNVYICDNPEIGHSVFVTQTGDIKHDKSFFIKNRSHKDIFLLHIDGVLFSRYTKCDCSIIVEKEFYFIEMKTNALNTTMKAIKTNYNKAKNQLYNTIILFIKVFKNIGVDLNKETNLKAFAVFNRTVPKDSAQQKKISVSFMKKTGGIPLLFENSAKF